MSLHRVFIGESFIPVLVYDLRITLTFTIGRYVTSSAYAADLKVLARLLHAVCAVLTMSALADHMGTNGGTD